MKKLLLPLAALLLLALAVPAAFSEAELGIGLSPGQVANPPDPNNVDPILNFHVGWSWTILYLSWDAFAMPDYWVYNNTSYVDPNTGVFNSGYYVYADGARQKSGNPVSETVSDPDDVSRFTMGTVEAAYQAALGPRTDITLRAADASARTVNI